LDYSLHQGFPPYLLSKIIDGNATKIFSPAREGKNLSNQKAQTVAFGRIYNDQEIIDEVLVTVFRAPHSYTGEDTAEITCHGSSFILQQVMQLLIKNGCRSALPGEYTQRAFLNGKMDLSQAEAVADLIASSSAATHRLAMSQMRGGFSKELNDLRTQLLNFTSLIELELDFSEEDVEFADREGLRNLAIEIEHIISRLVNSFNVGNVIKNGVPVALVGETNAGKSTLLNTLLNDDKAIVSDIHGTTRDVIEDTINIQGVTFRFIDTAGLRQTKDEIETLGIQKTFQKIEQANIILWIIDSNNNESDFNQLYKDIVPYSKDKKLILVFNKADLISPKQKTELLSKFKDLNAEHIFLSAKHNENIDKLENILVKTAALPSVSQSDIIVTNVRHFEALSQALEAIHRVQQGLDSNISGDFLSQDIRECIYFISDIVGSVSSQDVLENIFKNFCIGK